MKSRDGHILSLFVGILASSGWIILVMLFPIFFTSRGGAMPFDWWMIIAVGLGGAIIIFFAAIGLTRGITRIIQWFRTQKTR